MSRIVQIPPVSCRSHLANMTYIMIYDRPYRSYKAALCMLLVCIGTALFSARDCKKQQKICACTVMMVVAPNRSLFLIRVSSYVSEDVHHLEAIHS